MTTLTNRPLFLAQITNAFKVNPVVALLGPRQCGKTTLTQLYLKEQLKKKSIDFFDLENPQDIAALNSPMLTLDKNISFVVIDEIQRLPELFPILRVLVDKSERKRKFLILGSASRELIKQSSESLAGRISYIELTPFCYEEIKKHEALWLRGGFPEAYLAKDDMLSNEWRKAYITTYLEQDIPNLGITIPAQTLRRFWMMLAHYHGQIFNASEIGNSFGVAHTTVRRYLDILTGTFMMRELSPWSENIGKRQIKSPKIYFRDSGLFHTLLGISTMEELQRHPKLGASWEGFAVETLIHHHQAKPHETYFWGIHNQSELDLLIVKGNQRLGFEIKYGDAPKLTSSLLTARDTLNLNQLTVIYPGKKSYVLEDKIRVMGLKEYVNSAEKVI